MTRARAPPSHFLREGRRMFGPGTQELPVIVGIAHDSDATKAPKA